MALCYRITKILVTKMCGFNIRLATEDDLAQIIGLDEEITGLPKPEYWQDMFYRYGGERHNRFFLVACDTERVIGFTIGEVRAWEFGSPPCGWIFAINVSPSARLKSIGSELFDAIRKKLKEAGVDKVRTMLSKGDNLVMSFFRSQGMMAGPFIQLEMDIG